MLTRRAGQFGASAAKSWKNHRMDSLVGTQALRSMGASQRLAEMSRHPPVSRSRTSQGRPLVEAARSEWDRHYEKGCPRWTTGGISARSKELLARYSKGQDLLEVGCGI